MTPHQQASHTHTFLKKETILYQYGKFYHLYHLTSSQQPKAGGGGGGKVLGPISRSEMSYHFQASR